MSEADDVAAGLKLIQQQLQASPQAAPSIHDADADAGLKLIGTPVAKPPAPPDYTGWDTVVGPQGGVDAQMGLTGVRRALSSRPGDYQWGGALSLLPVTHSDVTGKNRLDIPQAIKNVGGGVLDLIEGPYTGTVTPKATGVLVDAALLGKPGLRFSAPSAAELTPGFAAAPVRPGALPQSALGSGGFRPSMSGESMPMPDMRAMSPATTQFVDALYTTMSRGISGGIGAAAGTPFGQWGSMGGMIAGQALNPVVKQMLQGLLPEQRAAVIANATMRGMGSFVRALGITAISPGTTPEPTESKIPTLTVTPSGSQWN